VDGGKACRLMSKDFCKQRVRASRRCSRGFVSRAGANRKYIPLKPGSTDMHPRQKGNMRFFSPVLLWPYFVGCPVSASKATLTSLTSPGVTHSWPTQEPEPREQDHPAEGTTLSFGAPSGDMFVASAQSSYVTNTTSSLDFFEGYFSRIPKTRVTVYQQPTRKYVVQRQVMSRQSIGTRMGR
jgi:hypothetical protein